MYVFSALGFFLCYFLFGCNRLFSGEGKIEHVSMLCRRPDPKKAKEFLEMIKLTSPATLSGYMQSVIRITGPEDVKNSPNAQRVRAAMISVASNIIPLYDCVDAQTHGSGGRHCEHRKDLLSNIQRIFYHSYDTVKHMVRSSAQLQFMDTEPGPGPPQQSPRSDVSSDSTDAEETPSRVRAAKGRQKWDNRGFECTESENERRCVYYSQGQLWPLVQLAIADKTIKLKAGSVTTMSIMRAALPLVLKSSNIRHISPIVTCMQRCAPWWLHTHASGTMFGALPAPWWLHVRSTVASPP